MDNSQSRRPARVTASLRAVRVPAIRPSRTGTPALVHNRPKSDIGGRSVSAGEPARAGNDQSTAFGEAVGESCCQPWLGVFGEASGSFGIDRTVRFAVLAGLTGRRQLDHGDLDHGRDVSQSCVRGRVPSVCTLKASRRSVPSSSSGQHLEAVHVGVAGHRDQLDRECCSAANPNQAPVHRVHVAPVDPRSPDQRNCSWRPARTRAARPGTGTDAECTTALRIIGVGVDQQVAFAAADASFDI